ncbi:hypothetical protein [Halomonas elongata]|uniref:hypothetical protein n=1 Tax=Halomonas elongata TaxID=2746 RepID=UPI0040334511
MSVSEIRCADDLAALANEAVQQVRMNKQYRDLISAILMANHIADWYYLKDLNQDFTSQEKETMKARYPEWDVLRKLANGTKHCKAQAKQDILQWGHVDFWRSPGHVGGDWFDWFVDVEGELRSVTVLIEIFLEQFSDSCSRPK